MRKSIIILIFTLSFSIAYGQKNDYFGSIIIPKNEYFIRLASTNLYWEISNDEVKIQKDGNQDKFMFIPAGNGFYFIKALRNGNYVTTEKSNLSKDKVLKISEPIRDDSQKYMVISLGNNQFKLRDVNNLVIGSFGGEDMVLRILDDKGSLEQAFEIIETESLKKL